MEENLPKPDTRQRVVAHLHSGGWFAHIRGAVEGLDADRIRLHEWFYHRDMVLEGDAFDDLVRTGIERSRFAEQIDLSTTPPGRRPYALARCGYYHGMPDSLSVSAEFETVVALLEASRNLGRDKVASGGDGAYEYTWEAVLWSRRYNAYCSLT